MQAFATRKLDWTPASRPCVLEHDQLHLWLIATSDLSTSGAIAGCPLSEAEARRAARIADPGKRRLYANGRLGLRMLLEGYTGIPSEKIRLAFGTRGKPGLSEEQGSLKFNYSVSCAYALYAFSRIRELGVDLEIHPRKINWKGLSGRILSDQELSGWNRVPHGKRNAAMMACWTRKEAYGKLLGVGIRYHMNQASLFLDPRRDSWCSPVAGLFESVCGPTQSRVHGIQIGLPVAGTAALMYGLPYQQSAQDTVPGLSSYRFLDGA